MGAWVAVGVAVGLALLEPGDEPCDLFVPLPDDPVKPAELFLEPARKCLIRRDGFVGMMDFECLRMNLVHRDVNMFMLLLAMADGDVLVFA